MNTSPAHYTPSLSPAEIRLLFLFLGTIKNVRTVRSVTSIRKKNQIKFIVKINSTVLTCIIKYIYLSRQIEIWFASSLL